MTNLADQPIGAVVPWQDGEETVMLEVAAEIEAGACVGCWLYLYDCSHINCVEHGVIFTLHNPKEPNEQ